jgi:nitrogen-specific signal transduction histidine kinase/CheY-like chemotaxis protein
MVRWLRHTATVVRPADRDPFILNTVRDVSAAKAAQESRDKIQRLEALGVLAGGIAHDFNNMLTGILANLSLSQDPAISREQAATLLHEAESAAHAAKQLVQQLMTFARGGAPALTSTLPGPLIADAVRFASRGSACQVVLTLADPMPPILCDAGQVTQVLHNLVLNGIEAMAGAGTLTVSAEYVDLADRAMAHLQAGRYLRIDVQDQGKGIRREDLVNVFDPYYSTKESGRGLGLATSHSIIRRHGGHMDVESREGGGSRFTVCLPATDEPSKPQAAFAAQPHAGSGRALVMDDEPMVVTVLSRILARLGYEPEAVGDGVAALAAYEHASSEGRPFSVVFMDLTIPGGMGGEEAVGKLKLLDPGARVIACSGYSEAPVMTSFETYGFAGVLRKPFTPAEVSAALAASGVGAPR